MFVDQLGKWLAFAPFHLRVAHRLIRREKIKRLCNILLHDSETTVETDENKYISQRLAARRETEFSSILTRCQRIFKYFDSIASGSLLFRRFLSLLFFLFVVYKCFVFEKHLLIVMFLYLLALMFIIESFSSFMRSIVYLKKK